MIGRCNLRPIDCATAELSDSGSALGVPFRRGGPTPGLRINTHEQHNWPTRNVLMISLPNCTRTTVLLSALLWLPSPAAADTWQEREQQRIESIADVAPSVVCVMPPTGEGGGSGVLVSADGYTITNFHVVSEAGSFFKCGLNDGRVYDAVLVGIDPAGDVAMI